MKSTTGQKRQERKRMETEYSLLGGAAQTEENEMDESGAVSKESSAVAVKNMDLLEHYTFFDVEKIRKSAKITAANRIRGEKLIQNGKIWIKDCSEGFDVYRGDKVAIIEATGQEREEKFDVTLVCSREEVAETECGCPNCRETYYYYSWRSAKSECPYRAAIVQLAADYLKTHNVGDATDRRGMRLLNQFQEQRVNHMRSDMEAKEECLQFLPRLTLKGGDLSVSFRIGTGRLFVVKKLDEFCEHVRNSETSTYGSSTEINHRIENFTDKGKEWIRFVNRIVDEEQEFMQRLSESRYYYGREKSSVGSSLPLFGWRLDQFYELMGDAPVDFEDKDGEKKKKGTILRSTGNPKVSMQISEEKFSGTKEFHGIRVTCRLPELYEGMETSYYIGGDRLYRLDTEFRERLRPFTDLASGGQVSFSVGRNSLAQFYYDALPQIQDIVKITEDNPKKFHSYLPPDVRFVFYLDADEQDITCRLHAKYGDREFTTLDMLHGENAEDPQTELFRDSRREEEVLYRTMQWLPVVRPDEDVLCCCGDEDTMCRMMEKGVDVLLGLGEVRCTNRFRSRRTIRRVKVSVGVSVSGGLLDLAISTEDIPHEELLDILNGYRQKKKYHRLKNGEFVTLEDQSVGMLSEMMDAMHLSDKELLKGKMHLPMYRTLYMDRMLEENESVYSERDSHFREVVKEFKTVKDADFEEPASLSRVMRKYQKNGYKWLRTLETWKFGGILADDMGLGKTLQVIAVLLAAKEEGKNGTSLVVTPASLVFNWGEELHRFAPQLSVLLVTGTQEDRKEKIAAWQEYDVMVTSYDLLKRDIGLYEEKQFRYEIIDEAQYIKNHTTAAAKAVKVITAATRYALTGTPIENRLSELWSIFDYLMPGFLYSYEVFKRELETPVVKNHDETAMQRLQKMVSPFILRRKKEDVLKDLPEKLEETRYVRFGREQQILYDGQVVRMKEKLAAQDDAEFNKNKLGILAELTKLRQLCCDPSLILENYHGEAAKLDACMQLIESAMDGGHRMLLFSQFTSMLEIIQRRLEEKKIPYYVITGATPKEKRLQMVKEFNEGEIPVFLISLKAGGVGLNLTGADMVIHYDPWWNVAAQNQATDRAHRIGQTKKVTVYKLIVKNSVEEKIEKLQEAKKDLAEQVIGGETGQLGSMTKEVFLALLDESGV